VLGLLYPALTLVVIVATANHFWLDAVGGVLCLAFGYAVARLWYGSGPYALPRRVAARGKGERRVGGGEGAVTAARGEGTAGVGAASGSPGETEGDATVDDGGGHVATGGGAGADARSGTGRRAP